YILSFVLTLILSINVFAKEQININFNNLEIDDFIKITSKIMNKNILLTSRIKGKIDFVSNKPIYKEDMINILIYVLESKGYTVLENEGILRVIKLSNVAKYNAPVYNNSKNLKSHKVITEVFKIDNINVDYVSSKIRHLISKSAKLVTDKESNTVVITDFVANIETVKKVISIISKDAKKTIRTIELKNIKGSSILSDLKSVAKSVFNEKILEQKVAILLNKDINSIMFVGNKNNVEFLVKYLKDIDKKGSLVEKTVEVIDLKNAEAKNILKIITGVIGQKVYKNKNNKPFASIEEESNSIVLMGPKEEISYFTTLIKKLDVDRQQVYVQARIIEVSEKRTRDVGIKYGLTGSMSNSNGLTSLSANLAENYSMPAIPLVSSTGGVINKDVLAMGASINLLNQNGAADIVSEPSLLCINNKKSTIYVGQTVSIKTTSSTTSAGIPNNSFKREDVGLTLSIKPRISNGGKVLLEIVTKVEDVSPTTTNEQPDTSKKELETSAIVNNGESVILGGYIKATNSSTIDKIPLLGDIPLLGALFRNTREVNDKINLVIIITPYIIPKSKDLTYIRNQLAQLKLLEDKYTKDTILRLEKAKLNAKKEDLIREQDKISLDEQKDDLKDDMIDFSEDKKEYEDEKEEEMKKELTEDEKLHQQRVSEIFGI
ncbi:MAG: secretin N-terminal domain-containing protein, partial [Campylobacterota bacterium]|nr:secretin N-terminal domain-containing protein [Campylobacterota bacterium]